MLKLFWRLVLPQHLNLTIRGVLFQPRLHCTWSETAGDAGWSLLWRRWCVNHIKFFCILLSELCVKQQSVWTCLWVQASSLSVNCMLLTHFQHFSWDLCTAGCCTGSVPRSSWEFNLTTQDRHFTLCLFCLCCDKFDFSSTCAAGIRSTYW